MQRKLRLELDALRVESFDTADARAGAGTVRGHQEDAEHEIVDEPGEVQPCTCGCTRDGACGSDTVCGAVTCGTNCFNTCYPGCTSPATGCNA